jgi:hypothetical protein
MLPEATPGDRDVYYDSEWVGEGRRGFVRRPSFSLLDDLLDQWLGHQVMRHKRSEGAPSPQRPAQGRTGSNFGAQSP